MTEQNLKKKRPRHSKKNQNNPKSEALAPPSQPDTSKPKRTRRRRRKRSVKNLSDHFSLRDFACKVSGCSAKKKVRVSLGLIGGLELLHQRSQQPIQIIKGYECDTHAKKSIYKNYHPSGIAAEIKIDTLDPTDVFKLAETIDEFLGLGLNLDTQTVYVDTRKENPQKWVSKDGIRTDITEHNRHQWFNESST